MHGHYPLSYHLGDGRIWTFGLSFHGHPELTMSAVTLGEVRRARLILFSLASLVLTTSASLEAGDVIHLGQDVVTLRASDARQLEVVAQPRDWPRQSSSHSPPNEGASVD